MKKDRIDDKDLARTNLDSYFPPLFSDENDLSGEARQISSDDLNLESFVEKLMEDHLDLLKPQNHTATSRKTQLD
jgi:hypothetical protein